jgi:hypothetical protein
VKLEPPELEQELAFGQTRHRILDRYPTAPVPHYHRTSPVVSLRNEPLEVPVLQGMILDENRQPLIRHVVRGTLRNSPGAEYPIHFEPQIEVQVPGGVLVDHEQAAGLTVTGRKT